MTSLPPSPSLPQHYCVDRPVSPCDKSITSAAETLIVSNYFLPSTLVVMAWRGRAGPRAGPRSCGSLTRRYHPGDGWRWRLVEGGSPISQTVGWLAGPHTGVLPLPRLSISPSPTAPPATRLVLHQPLIHGSSFYGIRRRLDRLQKLFWWLCW